ncbi:hypothetical protein L1787_09415 [Acuticoccus sp. M5D2P5]|uniref:hypothetical protein n=1 Tax=Acuticoccus kalidii TaxID=2910977 RepID=UPI001F3153C7|nr:hypothetical protein [Acuticoccus kalidii]MCF3933629.1 hypothetical protein [Acuticoccus kalidii]
MRTPPDDPETPQKRPPPEAPAGLTPRDTVAALMALLDADTRTPAADAAIPHAPVATPTAPPTTIEADESRGAPKGFTLCRTPDGLVLGVVLAPAGAAYETYEPQRRPAVVRELLDDGIIA